MLREVADMMRVRARKIRQGFALPDGFFKDPVHPLARPLNQAAPGKGFRQPAVARRLLGEDVFSRDPGGKPSGTHDFQMPGKLSDKY